MTNGYGVEPDELKRHANDVRDIVGERVSAAHEAAGYEPGFAEMGVLAFVITQMIDIKNDTDRLIMLAKEFGEDLTDRVEHAGENYQDIEDGNLELLNQIDVMEFEEELAQNPRGPRGGSSPPPSTDNPSEQPTDGQDDSQSDDETGDEPGHSDSPNPIDTPGSFTEDGIRIRTEPVDGTVDGLGYRDHDVTVHTGRTLPGHPEWVRVTDNTTGKSGWSHGDYVLWENDDPNDR